MITFFAVFLSSAVFATTPEQPHYTCPEMWGGPTLGVVVFSPSAGLRSHLELDAGGALVGATPTTGAAAAAGLELGDVVVSLGGERIADTWDLRRALTKAQGQTVDVHVLRVGKKHKLPIAVPPAASPRAFVPSAYEACLAEVEQAAMAERMSALLDLVGGLPSEQQVAVQQELTQLRAAAGAEIEQVCVVCHAPSDR